MALILSQRDKVEACFNKRYTYIKVKEIQRKKITEGCGFRKENEAKIDGCQKVGENREMATLMEISRKRK